MSHIRGRHSVNDGYYYAILLCVCVYRHANSNYACAQDKHPAQSYDFKLNHVLMQCILTSLRENVMHLCMLSRMLLKCVLEHFNIFITVRIHLFQVMKTFKQISTLVRSKIDERTGWVVCDHINNLVLVLIQWLPKNPISVDKEYYLRMLCFHKDKLYKLPVIIVIPN